MEINFACRLCKADLTVDIVVTSPATAGQYSGPPEHCYPAEGAEWHSIPEVVLCPECNTAHDIANDHDEMVQKAMYDTGMEWELFEYDFEEE